MRIAPLAAVFLLAACSHRIAKPIALEPDRVLNFERRNEVFLRAYLNCPKSGEISPLNCHPGAPVVDLRSFASLREAARKLFGFDK